MVNSPALVFLNIQLICLFFPSCCSSGIVFFYNLFNITTKTSQQLRNEIFAKQLPQQYQVYIISKSTCSHDSIIANTTPSPGRRENGMARVIFTSGYVIGRRFQDRTSIILTPSLERCGFLLILKKRLICNVLFNI